MLSEDLLKILKEKVNEKKYLNTKVIKCIFKDFPEIIQYLEEEVKNHPFVFKNIAHVAIFITKNIAIKTCKICGKELIIINFQIDVGIH